MAACSPISSTVFAWSCKTGNGRPSGDNMSTIARLTAGMLAALLVAAVWRQHRSLGEARGEKTRLKLIAAQPAQGPASREDLDEIERLGEQTRELPRCRNEVRQLRSQTNALAMLQAEWQGVLADLARMTNAPPAPPTVEEGFVMNHLWANAGLASPESTIQTYF